MGQKARLLKFAKRKLKECLDEVRELEEARWDNRTLIDQYGCFIASERTSDSQVLVYTPLLETYNQEERTLTNLIDKLVQKSVKYKNWVVKYES